MNVFISHANADTRWASAIGDHLKADGFKVWDSARELLPGDNWALKIGAALDACDAMVVLLSPASASSEAVGREVEFALGSETFRDRLVPVFVRATAKAPWFLRELPHVELKHDPAKASREIAKLLRRSRSAARSRRAARV